MTEKTVKLSQLRIKKKPQWMPTENEWHFIIHQQSLAKRNPYSFRHIVFSWKMSHVVQLDPGEIFTAGIPCPLPVSGFWNPRSSSTAVVNSFILRTEPQYRWVYTPAAIFFIEKFFPLLYCLQRNLWIGDILIGHRVHFPIHRSCYKQCNQWENCSQWRRRK